jgi:Zn finger protein HypA/HybF involved in hydrogenase expression
MSISMEPFASEGHFATYDAFKGSVGRVAIFQLQCHSCGYEPDESVTAPRLCPKCHGKTWERYARPGSILNNADRH